MIDDCLCVARKGVNFMADVLLFDQRSSVGRRRLLLEQPARLQTRLPYASVAVRQRRATVRRQSLGLAQLPGNQLSLQCFTSQNEKKTMLFFF